MKARSSSKTSLFLSLGLTVAVLAFVFAAAPLAAGSGAAPQPRLKFEAEKHDFGKVKQGQSVTYEFVFENRGDALLIIEKVETSCGCTAALLSEKNIAPGKKGKIKSTFETQGYGGRVTKYIFVESNDPSSPRVELAVTADVQTPPAPKIELNTYTIDMGLCLEGEEPSARVQVRNIGEIELRVEIAHQDFAFLVDGKAAVFPVKIAAGKSVLLEVRFPPQAKMGQMRDYVLLRSNDPARSTVSLYINRYVVSKRDLRDLFQKYRKLLEDKR
ncbi:MAG: DUF1573 domain-containing protein [Candidatus Aminicenantes bacterium]|nr:DUF1573 domain-containing protein [Candidatus Aminicenantes bacterium]